MKLIYNAILLTLLALAASCQKDKEDLDIDETFYSMVTVSSADVNIGTRFAMPQYDDAPEIELFAPGFYNSDVKEGERTMLFYHPTGSTNGQAQEIKVLSLTAVLNSKVKVTAHKEITSYKANPIEVTSIWRTGKYLNFAGLLQMVEGKRKFGLLVDEATVGSATVEMWIVDNIGDQAGLYYRRAYDSWDISEFWNNDATQRLRIHINNKTYPHKEYYDIVKN